MGAVLVELGFLRLAHLHIPCDARRRHDPIWLGCVVVSPGLVAVLAIMMCLVISSASTSAAGFSDPVTGNVWNDVDLRLGGMRALNLKWKRTYVPSGGDVEQVVRKFSLTPPTPYLLFQEYEDRFDWQSGSFRFHRSPADIAAAALFYDMSFDGSEIFTGTPETRMIPSGDLQPSLAVWSLERAVRDRPTSNWLIVDYLESAGYALAAHSNELGRRPLLSSRITADLARDGKLIGTDQVVLKGRPHTRVGVAVPLDGVEQSRRVSAKSLAEKLEAAEVPPEQIQAQLEGLKARQAQADGVLRYYYLDNEFGYAMSRIEERSMQGDLRQQAEMSAFEKVAGSSIWLPRKVVVTYYTWETAKLIYQEPVMRCVIDVEEMDGKIKDESYFTLKYETPGSYIIEKPASGDDRHWEVPAPPEELADAVGDNHSDDRVMQPWSPSTGLLVFAGLSLGVILVVARQFGGIILRHCRQDK